MRKIYTRAFVLYFSMFSIVVPSGMAFAQRSYSGADVHYAKTEVDKASGKCVKSVIGGALLGAALGGLIGGKRGLGIGALGGTAAGTTVCAVIMANAKHRDQIVAAQLAAAASANGSYTGTWADDNGKPVIFNAQAGTARSVDGARLIPVKYAAIGGMERASPVLDTGDRDCREVTGSFVGSKGTTPQQLVCRTASGDYEPYEERKV